MQMTERSYKQTERRLYEAKKELSVALEAQRDAASIGDLSENTEYETARADVERLTKEIDRLETSLRDAEIVPEDNSPRITIGSVVDVVRLDRDGKPVTEPRRFRYDASGDTVLMGVLGVRSSLGQAIYNGTSGVYTIPDNGGITYRVTKVVKG